MLAVFTLGNTTPSEDVIAEAAQLAGVDVNAVRLSESCSLRISDTVDLVICDESAAVAIARKYAEAPMPRLLIMCNGTLNPELMPLLRGGHADFARPDDVAAISVTFLRAARPEPNRTTPDCPCRANSITTHSIHGTSDTEVPHAQLQLTERMTAMSTLATGIGHDIGNLILPLRIGLESLETRHHPHESDPDLNAIRKSIEYLQELSAGLRYLAMDTSDVGVGTHFSDLTDWWSDVESLLHNCLPCGITLEHDFADNLPAVSLPLHHLTQIMLNLVQNAGEAMRDRNTGTVRITADSTDDRTSVRMRVVDNGPGMSHEVQARCIEPFFTTKHRGMRTGLGLPLVVSLVQQSGGQIELNTQPGKGATWKLLLPAQEHFQEVSSEVNPLAQVELADNRMRAYVSSVLRSLGFGIAMQATGDLPKLRIVAADSSAAIHAPSLLETDKQLRIVVFGPSSTACHERLYVLGSHPSATHIRAFMRDVRAALG